MTKQMENNKFKVLPKYFDNLTQIATRPMTIQRTEWGARGFYRIDKMRGVAVPFHGGTRAFYIESDDFKRGCKNESLKVFTKKGWKYHINQYKKGKKQFNAIEQKIKKINKNKNELLSIYQFWVNLISEWSIFAFFPFALENFIDPEFRKIIKEKYPNKFDEIINIVSSPSVINAYQEMRLEICGYIIKKDINATVKLEKKWAWYN